MKSTSKHNEKTKKITLRLPRDLYLSILKLVLFKHKGIHGHLNKECVNALEDHLKKEVDSI